MKEGWAGIHVAPAMEFAACQEAQRLGLTVWFPQRRVRIWPKGVTEPLMRAYPLFKGYLLAPLSQARDRAWHYARGVRGPKYLVEDAEGRPWTAPDAAVRELAQIEASGSFDDPLPHNMARLDGGALLAAVGGETLAQAFARLFAAPVVPPPVPPRPGSSTPDGQRLASEGRGGSTRRRSARRPRPTCSGGRRTTRLTIAPPSSAQPTLRGLTPVRLLSGGLTAHASPLARR
jgi:hypothetical protein